MKLYTSILLAFFLLLAQIGLAQTPVLPSSIDASMRDLQTFVSERAYMSSFQLAKELKRTSMYQNNSSVKEKVDFYLLVSGLQLDEKGIVEEATDFIKAAVDPAFRQMMTYYVGIYYFRNNNSILVWVSLKKRNNRSMLLDKLLAMYIMWMPIIIMVLLHSKKKIIR